MRRFFRLSERHKRPRRFENLEKRRVLAAVAFEPDKIIASSDVTSDGLAIMADFDNDGDDDVLYSKSNQLGWFKNNETQFESIRKIYDVPLSVYWSIKNVIPIDLDNDGDLDITFNLGSRDFAPDFDMLVDVNRGTNWFENLDGAGSFDQPKHLSSTEVIHWFDVETDGDLDLISIGSTTTISWQENEQGAFGDPQTLVNGLTFPINVKTADLDNDGDQDMVTSDPRGVKLHESTNGVFSDPVIIESEGIFTEDWAIPKRPTLHLVDIDGDNDIDLLTNSNWNSDLAWYENDSNNNFQDHGQLSSGLFASNINTGDIDADGDLDIVVDGWIWIEQTDTRVFAEQSVVDGGVWGNAVGNVDNDQRTDILNLVYESNQLSWYEQREDSNTFQQHDVNGGSLAVTDMELFDVDADGDNDLIVGSSSGALNWHEDTTGFGDFQTVHPIGNLTEIGGVEVADFDGDGITDIVASAAVDMSDHALVLYRGIDGIGNFDDGEIIAADWQWTGGLSTLDAGDIDGDGDIDLLTSGITIHENVNGDGTAWKRRSMSATIYMGGDLIVEDLDNDGDNDILATFANNNSVVWYENNGGGEFFRRFIGSQSNAKALSIADLDGDGDFDVLTHTGIRVQWYVNRNGQGLFSAPMVLGDRMAGSEVFASDVDNDGDLDVLTDNGWFEHLDGVDRFSAKMSLRLGNHAIPTDYNKDGFVDIIAHNSHQIEAFKNIAAPPSFGPERIITPPDGAVSADTALGDLDGDGFVDLVQGTQVGIVRFTNDGTGNFLQPDVIDTTYSNISIADLDSDGDLDILSANLDEERTEWYENENGQFKSPPHTIVVSRTSVNTHFDIDADGDEDVFFFYFGGEKKWSENLGNKEFAAPKVIPNLTGLASNVTPFDADMDGDLDLLGSGARDESEFGLGATPELLLAINEDGKGSFSKPRQLDSGIVNLVAVGDVDGDADFDIVAQQSEFLVWYENRNGDFETRHVIATEKFTAIAVADLDGDGDGEILATSQNELTFFVRNRASFQRRSHLLPSLLNAPAISIRLADLDQDGDIDPIVISQDGATTSIVNVMDVPGDIDLNGELTSEDVDLLCRQLHREEGGRDVNRDHLFDNADVEFLVEQLMGSTIGDVNQDGIFDSSDLVKIFQAGEYEDAEAGNSRWTTGDWNCDGDFTSTDLVIAFQDDRFVAAAVEAARTAVEEKRSQSLQFEYDPNPDYGRQ